MTSAIIPRSYAIQCPRATFVNDRTDEIGLCRNVMGVPYVDAGGGGYFYEITDPDVYVVIDGGRMYDDACHDLLAIIS